MVLQLYLWWSRLQHLPVWEDSHWLWCLLHFQLWRGGYLTIRRTRLAKSPRLILTHAPHEQNGRYFLDDILRCISVNEKFCMLIKFSLKFVRKGPIDNNPALVQTMASCRIGDKPLSEPRLTRFTDAYMRHYGGMSSYNLISKETTLWVDRLTIAIFCN